MLKLGLVLCLFILYAGCSQKNPEAHSQVVVSFGALVGATFPGGAVVQAVNSSTQEVKTIELVPPYNVILPFGVWSIYLVGSEGVNWQGPHACGGVAEYSFKQAEQTVKISVKPSTCLNEPYLTLKNFKTVNAKWDAAVWDSATWGP